MNNFSVNQISQCTDSLVVTRKRRMLRNIPLGSVIALDKHSSFEYRFNNWMLPGICTIVLLLPDGSEGGSFCCRDSRFVYIK